MSQRRQHHSSSAGSSSSRPSRKHSKGRTLVLSHRSLEDASLSAVLRQQEVQGGAAPVVALQVAHNALSAPQVLLDTLCQEGMASTLTLINASHNQWTVAPCPSSPALFPQLAALLATNNRISRIPVEFPLRWTHLQSLILNENALESLPDLSSLRQLHTLVLAKNRLTDQALQQANLGELPALRKLSLGHNQLQKFPVAVLACPALVELRLPGNKITLVEIPEKKKSRLAPLETLVLSNNPIHSKHNVKGLELLAGTLQNLSMRGCPLSETVPDRQQQPSKRAKQYVQWVREKLPQLVSLDDCLKFGFSEKQKTRRHRRLRAEHNTQRKTGTVVVEEEEVEMNMEKKEDRSGEDVEGALGQSGGCSSSSKPSMDGDAVAGRKRTATDVSSAVEPSKEDSSAASGVVSGLGVDLSRKIGGHVAHSNETTSTGEQPAEKRPKVEDESGATPVKKRKRKSRSSKKKAALESLQGALNAELGVGGW